MADGDETTLEFLDRRERVLSSRLEMALAAVDQLRGELEQIQRAKAALAKPIGPGLADIPYPNALSAATSALSGGGPASAANALMGAFNEDQSIKRLVKTAFITSADFRRFGASLGQLRQYISDSFNKDIPRTSLSPALSRLRDEGFLKASDNRWSLAPERMILELFRENHDLRIPEEGLQTSINNKFNVLLAVETIGATLIQLRNDGIVATDRGWVSLTRRAMEELGPAL